MSNKLVEYLLNLENDQLRKDDIIRRGTNVDRAKANTKGQGWPRPYIDLPTDDEDIVVDGSGWNREYEEHGGSVLGAERFSVDKRIKPYQEREENHHIDPNEHGAQDDQDDRSQSDEEPQLFGIRIPTWFHYGSSSKKQPTTTASTTTTPTTTTPTTTTTTTSTTTTSRPSTPLTTPDKRGRFSKSGSRFEHSDTSVDDIDHSIDILSYFKDVPREHWSCCMLGLLAGDKGFHCQAQYYAARITMRNTNRAHNRKLGFAGRHGDPDWGQETMQSFQRCIARKADEFHKCCYAATIEKREMAKWDWYRRRHQAEESVSPEELNATVVPDEMEQPGDAVEHLTNEMISDGGLSEVDEEETEYDSEEDGEDAYIPVGRQRLADAARRRLTSQRREVASQDSEDTGSEYDEPEEETEASRQKRMVLQQIADTRAERIRQRISKYRNRKSWRHHARVSA